jgi:hypothetical protein
VIRKAAALAVLPVTLLLGACAGTFSGTAAGRLESPLSGGGGEPAALQAAPVVSWRSQPGGWATGVRYAPLAGLQEDRPAVVRHRLAAEVGSARGAGLHPYGRLQVEYGTVRIGEVAEEGLEATPQPELLRSGALRLDGGARGQLTRRTFLRLGLGWDRSAGLGGSAATLPELTRTYAVVRAIHHRSRSTRLDAGVQASHLALAESALLLEADARATHELTAELAVFVSAGGAAARSGPAEVAARPIVSAGATYVSTDRARSASAALGTRPEFDRLDGTLRQRLHGQVALDSRIAGETRLALRAQATGDLPGAEAARRLLAADLSLNTPLTEGWSAELGVRAFIQGAAALGEGTAAPSRARLYFGLARRFD